MKRIKIIAIAALAVFLWHQVEWGYSLELYTLRPVAVYQRHSPDSGVADSASIEAYLVIPNEGEGKGYSEVKDTISFYSKRHGAKDDLYERCFDKCRRKADELGFGDISVPRYIQGERGSVDILDKFWNRSPREANLTEIAVWICDHIISNWSHLIHELKGDQEKDYFVRASFGRCVVGGKNALHMRFTDTGEGIEDIEKVFGRKNLRHEIQWRLDTGAPWDYTGWGILLTQALLKDFQIGNIKVDSLGNSITYYVDGSEVLGKSQIERGTEINIIIFPPLSSVIKNPQIRPEANSALSQI